MPDHALERSVRQLDPLIAFLMGIVGLGYVYVGKLSLGVAILLALAVLVGSLGWTGRTFEPSAIS